MQGPHLSALSAFHRSGAALHSSDTCEKQGQCPRSSGRRWRHSANAGGEACRRERQGTHPPRRLHAFGRSHPNPTLTTACLLHNAVRAGPIFEGSIAGDIYWHQLRQGASPSGARARACCMCVPAALHLVERWGCSRGRRLLWPAGACIAAQPTRVLMISLSFSLSAAARSQCIGTSGGKVQALSSTRRRLTSSAPPVWTAGGAHPARATGCAVQ